MIRHIYSSIIDNIKKLMETRFYIPVILNIERSSYFVWV